MNFPRETYLQDCNEVRPMWTIGLLSATTQFTPYAQNVHQKRKTPKRTLAFSGISSKQLGIFSPNFTRLSYVFVYARLQIFVQLSPTVTKLCHILSATTQRAFRPMVDIFSMMVVALNIMA